MLVLSPSLLLACSPAPSRRPPLITLMLTPVSPPPSPLSPPFRPADPLSINWVTLSFDHTYPQKYPHSGAAADTLCFAGVYKQLEGAKLTFYREVRVNHSTQQL